MVHRQKRFKIFFTFVGVFVWSLLPASAQEGADKTKIATENQKIKSEDGVFQGGRGEDFWEDLVEGKDITPQNEKIPDWQARWELARLLGYQDKYAEALKEYRKVLDEKPDDPRIKIEMAYLYYSKGEPEKSEQLLSGLVDEETKNLPPEELMMLAEILTSGKKYEQAIEIYKTVLDKHGSRPQVRYYLARVLSWADQYEESLAQYRKILEKRPNDKSVRRHYARVLKWSGQHEKAAEEFRKTLEERQ